MEYGRDPVRQSMRSCSAAASVRAVWPPFLLVPHTDSSDESGSDVHNEIVQWLRELIDVEEC